MNYKECIQDSINFIEKNLKRDFTLQEVADSCYISYYHFSRIFRAVLGISISEYIKRRRLSESAIELQNLNKNILQIALEYRFDSQETFTRNFKKYFDITPGKYRKINEKIQLYAKNDFFLELNLTNSKGIVKMDVKVVEKEVMKLVGIEKEVDCNETHHENPKLWEKFLKRYAEIENKENTHSCLELSTEYEIGKSFKAFPCCVVLDNTNIPKGMSTKELPASKYLVFTHKGAIITPKGSALNDSYEYIYGKYIPNSDYEIYSDFSFELYDANKFKGPEDPNGEIDIYIPIK